jgi:hypothetical protein
VGVDRGHRVGWDDRVPEYDAFGREIGEDPLAAMREATAAAQPSKPAPAAVEAIVAEPPQPAPVAAHPQFVRPRRRRRGGFTGLIVVFALLAVLGVLSNVAVDEIESGIEGLVEAEEPAGLGPASMIREANLAAALEQMRESGLGRPLTLRLDPSRVEARLVARDGRVSRVRVTTGELRTVGSRQGPRGRSGIAYARIDAAAPERLVRDAGGRHIRFLRLDRFGWRAYFRDGSVARGR